MDQSILSSKFSESIFTKITEHLIDAQFTEDTRAIVTDKDSKYIKSIKNHGVYEDLGIQILIVEHSSETDARVGLSKEIFSILKRYSIHNAIVATYNGGSYWRYSLLTTSLKINESGKVNREFSNPKRYSYQLGPGAKTATAYKYLIKSGKIKDFNDLHQRFSVEVVNNDFYKEIAKLYDSLVEGGDVDRRLVYPGTEEKAHEFSVRLLGRIIFCWFLRKKVSTNGTPMISPELLSREAAASSNYYHGILAPLFFEVLNKNITDRNDLFRTGMYGKVPYLNGGLFNPDVDDHYKFDKDLSMSVPGIVSVPDEWLRELFDLLELYNFTIDENTSFDVDLSIDPEMLGRIFENLLARINPETGETVRKATGSFYTPREIVEFMVDQSIKQYLVDSTSIEANKISAIITYDLIDDLDSPLSSEEKTYIIEALDKLKIIDPACGSGAFPIAILQKIVFILQQVDPNSEHWLQKQLANSSPEFRHHIESEFKNKNYDYLRKLGVIRKTIYGVDIQPIATEISRLRCFLTLVVEQSIDDSSKNRGIEPLPNLDFKFVTANTLIPIDTASDFSDQVGLFEDSTGISELRTVRDEYFTSHNSQREILKSKFLQIQNKMLQRMIQHHTHGIADSTQKLSKWDPFSHECTSWFDVDWMFGVVEGFDIVIGNPPYFVYEGFHKPEIPILRNYAEYKPAFVGKINAYKLFIVKSMSILKAENGVLSLIFQNSFLGDKSARLVRKFVFDHASILSIDSFPERDNAKLRVFEGVKMSVCVLLAKKCIVPSADHRSSLTIWKDKKMQHKITSSTFSQSEALNIDPELGSIPLASDEEKRILIKLLEHNQQKFKDLYNCYQGEINLSVYKDKLTSESSISRYKVLRGAEVVRYRITNNPSQGEAIYLDKTSFVSSGEKAKHHLKERIVMQGISGVNETYRLKAAIMEPGVLCGHSCNYLIENYSGISSYCAVGLLNSNLLNWFFSVSSTNSNVNSYEVNQLPLPKTLENKITDEIERTTALLQKIVEPGAEKKHEKRLNELVYALYGVSDHDISVIESHFIK